MPVHHHYAPYKTQARWDGQGRNDNVTRQRILLFDSLKTPSKDLRAQALAQLHSNLLSWAKLAYPDHSLHEDDRAGQKESTSFTSEALFNLDTGDDWKDHKTADGTALNRDIHIRGAFPQTPPVLASSSSLSQYADYFMYGAEDTNESAGPSTDEMREILRPYLLSILRLCMDCPFDDVRAECQQILEEIHSIGVPVPVAVCDSPSCLIPKAQTVAFGSSYDDSDEDNADSEVESQVSSTDVLETATPVNEQTTASAEPIFTTSEPSPDLPATECPVMPIDIDKPVRKPPRVPQDSADIDSVLLAPAASSASNRRAHFDTTLQLSSTTVRPVLGRKRTNSTTISANLYHASTNTKALHKDCYLNTGRVTNIGRILSYFPRFYESTLQLHDELIRKHSGPLPRAIKLYLSTMASAHCNCQYFVSYYSKKFLEEGRETDWLRHIDAAPRKIQRLGKICSLIATQPWKIRPRHIEELLERSQESSQSGDSSDQWTIAELVQSLAILVITNNQAHFALAVGIVPEPDTFGGAWVRSETDTTPDQRHKYFVSQSWRPPGSQAIAMEFPEVETNSTQTDESPVNLALEDMSRFQDSSITHEKSAFDSTNAEFGWTSLDDCNWEDHTCPLIGRFVPDLEVVLDQNIQEARVAAGDEDDGFLFSTESGVIDQGPLREAVWFFILELYGIHNDGYDYDDIDVLLTPPARSFLEKVCFEPENISRLDWRSMGKGLKAQEQVLLALLASNARQYVCLVFTFRYCI